METAAIDKQTKSALAVEERAPTGKRALLVAGILVFSLCVLVFTEGRPQNSGAVNPVAWRLAAIVGLSVGILLTIGLGLAKCRQGWQKRLQAVEAHWRSKNAELEVELITSRRAEEASAQSEGEARKQLAGLQESADALRAQLDQRKRSEQNLSQQRQVLQSSKTVLELHVQARTQELQALQRRYEMILNSAGEGICGFNREGKAIFVNPAVGKLTGWPINELVGKTEQDIFQHDGASSQTRLKADERIFLRKDGTFFPAEFVRTPIEEQGQETGAVLVFKDITERKRTEEALARQAAELSRSNAELEQFAFVASHDLQEPLRKIQSFADRLKTKAEGVLPPEAGDYLERMQGAAARMRTLIDDLLAFSRVIRDSEPFASVNLATIAKEVLGDLELRIETTKARIEVGELPSIEADPLQMRQLLLNLIGNALKFQPAGAQPVVSVTARKFVTTAGNEFCELRVQDNGIGFDPQYTEKIFGVFQRLHGRGEYGGTGVGLAICRRIADHHKGSITAESQAGKGATFIVTLPVCQTNSQKAS